MTPIIDLTHLIAPGMPVFPGDDPPILERAASVEADGFTTRSIRLNSHTGTHVDAPAHIIAGAPTLDAFPVSQFAGRATLIDVRGLAGRRIGVDVVKAHAARVHEAEFVLFRSGWQQRWGDPSYFEDYPVLSDEAAGWLAGAGLKGVGVDMISVDSLDSTSLPIHHILLGAGVLIIENLTHLDQLPTGSSFDFACYPLHLQNADGAPVRAVARVRTD